VIASRNGDFLVVIEQLARFVRRLLDFRSMARESLVNGLQDVSNVINLMAGNPRWMRVGAVYLNKTDTFSRGISAFTGLLDGSFNAKNITLCRNSLILFSSSISNLSIAISNNDQNNTVYYSTRALKYTHPSLFHCYYAGKETYTTYL
jgi:hypothetical protein